MEENERRQRLLSAFQLFDPSGSGKVPTDSLLLILQSCGKPLTDEERKEFVADADDGGHVNYNNFVKNVVFGET